MIHLDPVIQKYPSDVAEPLLSLLAQIETKESDILSSGCASRKANDHVELLSKGPPRKSN